jgi:WD40 repeat protein
MIRRMRERFIKRMRGIVCGTIVGGTIVCAAIVCGAIAVGFAAQTATSQGTPSQGVPDRAVLEIVEQRSDSADALAFNADGTVLATVNSGSVTLWDVETGLEVRRFTRSQTRTVLNRPRDLPDASYSNAGVALDPSGRYVASTDLNDRTWRSWNASSRLAPPNVWDVRTGRALSDVQWHYDAAQERAIGSGFPFQAREPELWQYARDQASLSRLLGYDGPAQFFNRDVTLGAVVIGTDAYPWKPETIQIVDLASGKARWQWVMESEGLSRVTFSPDGRWVMATGFESGSRIWDLQTGEAVDSSKFGNLQRAHTIAFTPDGTRAVVTRDATICLLATRDWSTISCPHTGDAEPFEAVALSPDGRRIAAAHDYPRRHRVHVWDVESGRELRQIDMHGAWPMVSVAVSPDGRWLAAGTERDWYDDDRASVLLWPLGGEGDAGGMRMVWQEEQAAIQSLAFSPDSRRLVAASVGAVMARESGVLRGQVSLCELPACGDVVRVLDDGRSEDRPNRLVFPEAAAEGAAFTPDGRTLIALVLGISAHTDEEIRTHEYQPYSRLVFYDAVASKPREGRVVRPRRARDRFDPDNEFNDAEPFSMFALSPDGRRVATAYGGDSFDGRTVDLWSATTGRILRHLGSGREGTTKVEGVNGAALGLAFSPDGRWLATTGGGSDGAFVAIWNASTGQLVRTVDRHRPAGVRGELPAPENSSLLPGPFHPVAFHPDGTQLVAAECGGDHWPPDRRARIIMWDVTGTSARWSVETTGRCVEQLAFGGNGRWIASAGSNGLTFRDANTGALLLTLAVRGSDQWMAWTPDGRYTGTDAGIARLAAIRDGERVRARPLSTLPPDARVPDLLQRVLNPR